MVATARAETVGSLLRADYVREMRQALREGKVSPEERKQVEDRAVLEAIALQESVGLDVVSDGELRRTSWIATAPLTTDVTHRPAFNGFQVLDNAGPGWIRFWHDNKGNTINRGFRARSVVTDRLSFANDITHEYQSSETTPYSHKVLLSRSFLPPDLLPSRIVEGSLRDFARVSV
jgi:methionine synthase II (cobalamin-independent)